MEQYMMVVVLIRMLDGIRLSFTPTAYSVY